MSKSKQHAPKNVVVIGSAHIDVLSDFTSHEDTIDKPGKMDVQVGGTAYNVAVNLAAMGVPVTMVTAMNKTLPINNMIAQTLEQQGVLLRFEHNPNLPISGFNGHTFHGDLVSAVASVNIDQHEFSESFLAEILATADFVVAECNLSASTLRQVAQLATSGGIPFACCAVSEAKSLRMSDADINPDYLFANAAEHSYLVKHENGEDKRGYCAFITQGANGVRVREPNASYVAPAPLLPGGEQQYMGAGDAFTAGAVKSLLEYPGDMNTAVSEGQKLAKEVIEVQHCNRGKGDVFNSHIARLEQDANLDPLTGLSNRRAAEKWFAKISNGPQKLGYSVLLMDIDKFKGINDTYGHSVGDDVISAVAGVLRQHLRDDDIGVRWGGEEFLVAMKAPLAAAEKAGQRVLAAVRELRFDSCPELNNKVTISIGVAPYGDVPKPDTVIEAADKALYQAKQSGRNRLVLS